MNARWEVGRAEIDALLQQQRLTRVRANRDLADDYLRQARQHVESARSLVSTDPEGAFQLAYDSSRKSLAAVLVNQGLRASGSGAHATIYDAVKAQLGASEPTEFRVFPWMRRTRNATEYPDIGDKTADEADALDAVAAAEKFPTLVARLLEVMPPY